VNVLVALPIVRFACRVAIEKGRSWSVADELLLWAATRDAMTIGTLSTESGLPHQVVVSSLSRLMRFRLVEAQIGDGRALFRASGLGANIVRSGQPIPYFPTRSSRRLSFVVEQVARGIFSKREVKIVSPQKLQRERNQGADVRIVRVEGAPPVSHETNFARLEELVSRGWEERLAGVDARTASVHEGDFMVVRVTDGVPRGLPRDVSKELMGVIGEVASAAKGVQEVAVAYRGPEEEASPMGQPVACDLEPSDIVVGGESHRACLHDLLAKAHRRLLLHSTFVDPKRFDELFDSVREACQRGVAIDVLWGAEADDETERKNHAAAIEIMNRARRHSATRGLVRVSRESTGSHAKLLLLDVADGSWIGAVGSCNWLSSPFGSVELTVILRDPHAVAQVAHALQLLAGRRGLSDEIASEMAILRRKLCEHPAGKGTALMSLVAGEAHDRLMREASGAAQRRMVVGSHRLGSTARSGALLPGEFAAKRSGVAVTILYTRASGPMDKSDARALEVEAAQSGVRLVRAQGVRVHGKFVAWDDDDLIVTSLNWASASGDPEFAEGELGVHLKAPGVARYALGKLAALVPELHDVVDAARDTHG
jgi:cardiolipin synthase A/B